MSSRFFEQSNFEQMIMTRQNINLRKNRFNQIIFGRTAYSNKINWHPPVLHVFRLRWASFHREIRKRVPGPSCSTTENKRKKQWLDSFFAIVCKTKTVMTWHFICDSSELKNVLPSTEVKISWHGNFLDSK